MYQDWINIIPNLMDNIDDLGQVKCPICGKHSVEYLYIGDKKTRMGYLQLWCSLCLKGIYVSRAKAPENARMLEFEDKENLKKLIPKYEFLNE